MLAEPIKLNSNLGYYTNFMNLLDLAAIAVPAGFLSNGLPFGIAFGAPALSDHALLELARRWQTAFPLALGATAFKRTQSLSQPEPGMILVAVCGARLCRTTRSAAKYRLYALAGSGCAATGDVEERGG